MRRFSMVIASLCLVGCSIAGKGGKAGGGGDGPGGLTEEAWTDAFFAKMCEESENCGGGAMADMWCNPNTTGTTTGGQQCTFDPARGQDCLDGEYICNDDLTDFEFVEPPQACLEVFDCGTVQDGSVGTTSTP